MKEGAGNGRLRFTCPPCGQVFVADDEDRLIQLSIEHSRKLHDVDLLAQFSYDELRSLARQENERYWAQIQHLFPEQLATVIDEALCEREREIVEFVVHGFSNKEIAARLGISERTVSTHLVNVYEKLDVHSRAELTALVRAADRIIEAGLRSDQREFGPFVQTKS